MENRILSFVFALLCGSCDAEISTQAIPSPTEVEDFIPLRVIPYSPTTALQGGNPSRWDFPNECETFEIVEGKAGSVRYRRKRFPRSRGDRENVLQTIRAVGQEMGVSRSGIAMLEMIARHESSVEPRAVHVLNPDLEANSGAWSKFSYSAEKEAALRESLDNPSHPNHWKAKAQFRKISLYRNNEYWNSRVEVSRRGNNSIVAESRSVWEFGYGLYGMNAVLYTHVFSREAPPWVLCADHGIVATITAIWAIREQQQSCIRLSAKNPERYGSDGGSLRSLIHRWGSGRCGQGTPGKAWERVRTIPWETYPKFGKKYPRGSGDSYEIYQQIRNRVEQQT